MPLIVHGEALATAVAAAWADSRVGWAEECPAGVTEPLHVVVGSSHQADVAGADVDEVLHKLNHAVISAAITRQHEEFVILRAAALADPTTGSAIVLVASPCTGLTTAVRELGRTWAVVGDEAVGIHPDGSVVSVLGPQTTSDPKHANARVPMTSLGLHTTHGPCHLHGLAVLDRSASHKGVPDVTRLATVDAIGLLAAETRNLGPLGTPLRMIASIVDRAGGARHVAYGEAASLTPLVDRALAGARR